MNQIPLENKIDEAKKAEETEDFFRASFLYKDALDSAIKSNNAEVIKFCKNKVVEMNKKSIASGKDFKDVSFTRELPENKKKAHEEFINKFLNQGDLKTILCAIGKEPSFIPKVTNVQKTKNNTMPIFDQFANSSIISNDGHILRGSSDRNYAWLMTMYNLNQQLIMILYVGRIIYELIENKPNGNNLTADTLLDYFNNSGIIEEENLKIISVGLKKYFERDYISALHILVPQFESVFLKISEKFGIDIVALDQKKGIATRTKTLSEYYLDSDEFKKVWTEDFCRQIKFILFEQLGYRIRHKIAHGEITKEECNFQNTTLILYLYLVLLSRVNIKSQ